MADSLRDQLLKSGIVKQVREEKRQTQPQGGKGAPPKGGGGRHGGKSQQQGRPSAPAAKKPSGEMDLAKAYAIRAQTEATERKRAEQEAQEQARIKREQKQKIQQLLQGKALNKNDVEQVRHFEYGGKIRRVHVDAEQLAAINTGELGVVQIGGRYLIVSREIATQVREIDAHQLALLVDPNASGVGDDGVPDDLIW